MINATGVWADQLRPDELYGEEEMPRIRPSRGTHVTLSREHLAVEAGVIVPAGGGRTVFVLPWLGRTLVGTTDNDYEGALEHVPASRRRHRLPARGRQRLLRHRRSGPADLTGAYAGVRPLISTGDPKKSVDISRKAELYETSSGLVTITGGKLTTWRRMAKSAVDRIVEREGREAPCRTHEIPLGLPEDPAALPEVPGVDEASRVAPGRPLRARRARRAAAGGRGARSWPRASARTCPTSWPRPPSPPATSRRARSPTCCCAAPGWGCSTRATCPAPDSEGARRAARAMAGELGWDDARIEQELRDWAEVARPRASCRPGRRRAAASPKRARRRRCGGWRRAGGGGVSGPLLMGIVNATPDSFSDAQGHEAARRAGRARPRAG